MGLGALAMDTTPRAQPEQEEDRAGTTPAWELGQRRLEDSGCVAVGQEAGRGWCDLGRPQEEPQEGITAGIGRAALGGDSSEQQCVVTPSLPCISVCTADHTLPLPLAPLP